MSILVKSSLINDENSCEAGSKQLAIWGSKLLSQLFTIEHPLITLELAIAKVDTLHIHEEIIPSAMYRLSNKILEDSYFLHPIIVDKVTRVVLDGMHRVAASKELSLCNIPVCFVDYYNPNISIGCWYRTFRDLRDINEVDAVLHKLGLRYKNAEIAEARISVEKRIVAAALYTRSSTFMIYDGQCDAEATYMTIKSIEKAFMHMHEMGFATEQDAIEKTSRGEYSACILTPTLKKEEVVRVAKAGRVFPQKTTRHIIPARPMGVKVPIEWLVSSKSEVELSLDLNKYLSSRVIRVMPSGTVVDRRYEEPLYVFQ